MKLYFIDNYLKYNSIHLNITLFPGLCVCRSLLVAEYAVLWTTNIGEKQMLTLIIPRQS